MPHGTRSDHLCAERLHPPDQRAVGGGDEASAFKRPLADHLDDGIVSRASGGDDLHALDAADPARASFNERTNIQFKCTRLFILHW